ATKYPRTARIPLKKTVINDFLSFLGGCDIVPLFLFFNFFGVYHDFSLIFSKFYLFLNAK
ncbi:hypothetical protein, partial [Escherichia coli]